MPPRPRFQIKPSIASALGIILMFIFGLSIPKVSDLAVMMLFAMGAWMTRHHHRLQTSDAFTIGLLAAFLVAFFVPSAYYGLTDPLANLKDGALILMCYGSGLLWAKRMDEHASRPWMPIALAAGFTIFSALSVLADPSKVASFLNPNRVAPNFWSGGEPINGTMLGVYASLGLCLLPVAFLWRMEPEGKHRLLPSLILFVIAGAGLLSNLVMQNRSPYVALGLSFLLCGWLYLRGTAGSPAARTGSLLLRLSPLIVIGLVLVITFPDFVTEILFRRFGDQGGDTGGRVQAWIAVIQNLPLQPFGGKATHLGGPRFAHNLWMDAAYNSGLLALLALLLFHVAHLPFILRFYRRRLALTELLVTAAIGASMFMGCMVEPILDGSRLYLGGTCFLLAWMKARVQGATSSSTSD